MSLENYCALKEGGFIDMEKYFEPETFAESFVVGGFCRDLEDFKYILNYCSLPHRARPMRERIQPLINSLGLAYIWEPGCLRELLGGIGDIAAAEFQASIAEGVSPLHYISLAYGHSRCWELVAGLNLENPEWARLIQDTVKLCDDLHRSHELKIPRPLMGSPWVEWSTGSPVTLLFCVLLGVTQEIRYRLESRRRFDIKIMEAVLHDWLRALEDTGVDLQSYGEKELAFFEASEFRSKRWLNWFDRLGIRVGYLAFYRDNLPKLVRFKYGPRIEDWSLEWDMEVEEFAGDFWGIWDNLEAPLMQVPGAWVDD